MMNADLENFFVLNKSKKWVWKRKEHCDIVLSEKDNVSWDGILLLEQIIDTDASWKKEKFQKYMIPNKKTINYEEYIEQFGPKDYSTFDILIGHDIEEDKPVMVNMFDRLHSAVLWTTGSGKSVELKFLLSQFLRNPHTEFYIIDKGDFDMLKPTAKVAFKSKTDAMKGTEFFNFIKYFWLMANDRMKYFASLGCNEWRDYKKNYMGKSPEYENINYVIVIIDEYQTLRSSLAESVAPEVFDRMMKQILDYVRSAWILFYFWTQDLQKDRVGNIRDAWASMILGKMKYIMPWAVEPNVAKNLEYRMNGTYMFYDVGTAKYLKIPFSPKMNQILVDLSNDPKNRLWEVQKYEKPYELLNTQLDKVDSDIFSDVYGLMNYLKIPKTLVDKLKRTSFYPAFVTLCFVLVRGIQNNLITRSFNIFEKISFPKPVDNELFDYIYIYEGSKEFLKVLKEAFELSSDRDEFIEHINYILVNYLKTIVADTALKFDSPEEDEENIEWEETFQEEKEEIEANSDESEEGLKKN